MEHGKEVAMNGADVVFIREVWGALGLGAALYLREFQKRLLAEPRILSDTPQARAFPIGAFDARRLPLNHSDPNTMNVIKTLLPFSAVTLLALPVSKYGT
jgi:hypothetical protein